MGENLKDDILKKIFFISERVVVLDGMEDVFKYILKTAVYITRANAATMRLFDIPTGMLKIVGSFDVSNHFLSQPPLNFGEGIVGKVIREGKSFSTKDVRNVKFYVHKELAELEQIRDIVCVPLKTQDATK